LTRDRSADIVVPPHSGRMRIFARHLIPKPGLIVAPLFGRAFGSSHRLVEPITAMLVRYQLVVAVGVAKRIVVVFSD
jgi:hypothetical protein